MELGELVGVVLEGVKSSLILSFIFLGLCSISYLTSSQNVFY